MAKYLPGKYLDVLFDISRFRVGKAHDQLEEVLGALLVLRHCDRSEPLQISTNAVLLLDRESHPNERFQKVDAVDGCHETLVLVFSVDARDDDTIRYVLGLRDCSEGCVDDGAFLPTPELYQPPFGVPFLLIPTHRTRKISDQDSCLLQGTQF